MQHKKQEMRSLRNDLLLHKASIFACNFVHYFTIELQVSF